MTERTLADEIITIVKSVANNNPAPAVCTITKIYEDGFVDVTLQDGGIVAYLECIGRSAVGNNALLVFADGDLSNGKVVSIDNYTQSEVDEMIGGGADLTKYIRKDEFLDLFTVDFNYELGNPLVYRDGNLMLDIFLKKK